MKLILIITSLTLLVLVRSNRVDRKNVVICEFFKNIEEAHAEQWEDSVNLLKTLLGQTITATSAYPQYRNFTASLQDYLDRGKSIDQSASVKKKIEYFQGFDESENKPTLVTFSEKERGLIRPLDSFSLSMMSVLEKFFTKYSKAGRDMGETLNAMKVTFSGDLFMLLYEYPPEYKGRGIKSLGSQILAFKNRYPCD